MDPTLCLGYSTRYLTNVKYALSFSDVAPMLRLRLRNLIVWFALSEMLKCRSHFKSSVKVTPKYLADLTMVRVW